MEKATVLTHLKKHIETKLSTLPDTKRKEREKKQALISTFKAIREEDISFGPLPSYFCGYLECNSTGVGKSTFGNTETQRTVARDYTTGELLFIDGHEGTCIKGIELLLLKPNQTVNYYKKSEMEKAAKREGFLIHQQYFRDLNFSVSDHRLNRYKLHYTKEPFTLPVRAIFAKMAKDDKKLLLGYVYEKNGQEYILIEPEDPMKSANEKKNWGCLLALGLFFPPIGLVMLFVFLGKAILKRWVG